MKPEIQSLKNDLLHWLIELKDIQTLKKLHAFKENTDWWEQISVEERQAIEEGLAQLDNGESIDYEQAVQQLRTKHELK